MNLAPVKVEDVTVNLLVMEDSILTQSIDPFPDL